jgi:NADH:ubiquinone oxidoreductase subunit 5 (subunit L)/multisubunit Na+/H+ antiporter MnhA subunit
MLASVGIAAFGIFVAYQAYYRKVISPEIFSSAGGGVPYNFVYNKYYVDELYQATFVRLTLFLSWLGSSFDRYVIDFIVDNTARVTAWVSWLNGLFDNWVIDGLVNTLADTTFAIGNRLRQVQTGNINVYLYVIVGAVAGGTFLPRLSPQIILYLVVVSFVAVVLTGIWLLAFGRRQA